MSQSAFLSKLYEIKPFKIVESPETKKQSLSDLISESSNNYAHHSYQNNIVQRNPPTSPQLYPYSNQPLNTHYSNNFINSTPSRKEYTVPQHIDSSSKKIKHSHSMKQPASPHRVIVIKKGESQMGQHLEKLVSPQRTPNKQNRIPVGGMIESQLYSNLSSSIDTLFSKIEKIKQQFDCPVEKSKGKKESIQGKLSSGKNQSYDGRFKKQNSLYSPIGQRQSSQNRSIKSFNQMVKQINHYANNNSAFVNLNSEDLEKMNKKKSEQDQNTSLQRLLLPATHFNKQQKKKTVLEEMNALIQSNNKNYPNNNFQNFHKSNGDLQQSSQRSLIHNFNAFEDFDDQFTTIKLKPTQSQNATYTPSFVQVHQKQKNKNLDKSEADKDYLNVSYKIPKPQFMEQGFIYSIDKLEIPLSMKQFELGKCVGSGKFGDVHICKHKQTGFVFALKKIFKSTIKEFNMVQQLIQQLKIHYTLSQNSQNITKLYAHFEDEYHIFLLMQYIQDGTLMGHLKKSEQFVSQIICQVLNAVQYLHRNNIVHRDIKPENILISNGVVKLCDFGWSSKFKDEMRRTFCGTLDYISPQMKDKGQYNTSVDLWSIGVLTFELLAGFPPYKKQIDKWKFMGGNFKDKWRWDVLFPPEISQIAKQFIEKLLKQNPDQRMSLRECRQSQFIKKYKRDENEGWISKQIKRILQIE